ncbi:MAG TPA: hypothetical protein GYA10_13380 [Alphaproteobacteria bacterium]|nr:hypothetical protein [Alphaproteobacteria bacterium]
MTLTRSIRAAIVVLALATVAAPALAGEREVAYLQSLAGTWSGKGRITGAEAGTVTCRLTLRPSGERLNFNGRCAMSGGSVPQSFSGSIRYNDKKGVYESSSQGRTVAGKKSGSSLVFTTSMSDMRGRGTSTMTMSPDAIKVQFKMVNGRTGEASQGSIPFTKR